MLVDCRNASAKALIKTMAHKIYSSVDNNSYWRVCDPQNVLHATYNTMRGKYGRYDVQKFMGTGYIERITDIWEMLDKQTYVPSKYHEKDIYDVKVRHLKIAPLYPDRVIHHCLIDVIETDLKKLFIANTYACIKGRGIHACLNDLKKALFNDKRGTKYCLKIDIHHYYDSIVHSILKQIISEKYGDERMLWLMYTIIDSTEGDVGLPIGFLTSQHFANWYLTLFDHWMKEVIRVKYYYRYMDDIVILSDSKEHLHMVFEQMQQYLADKLKLEIKENWQIFPVDARSIDFVGYKSNHYNILARKSILYTYYHKLRIIAKKYDIADEGMIKHELAAHWGWLKHCSEEHFNTIIDNSKKQLNYEQQIKTRGTHQ